MVTRKEVLSSVFAFRGGRVVACSIVYVGKREPNSKTVIRAYKKKKTPKTSNQIRQ